MPLGQAMFPRTFRRKFQSSRDRQFEQIRLPMLRDPGGEFLESSSHAPVSHFLDIAFNIGDELIHIYLWRSCASRGIAKHQPMADLKDPGREHLVLRLFGQFLQNRKEGYSKSEK